MSRLARRFAWAPLALALACGEDKVTPLRDEIAKLKKERVPVEQLETARKEAAESEAARDAAVVRAGEAEAALAKAKVELERQRAALDHEAERNAEIRRQIDDQREPLAAASASLDALEVQATERRRKLTVLRDQARALGSAMHPGDPEWAAARRLTALRDFERAVRAQLPGESAVAALSKALAADPIQNDAVATALRGVADELDRLAQSGEPSKPKG